MKLRQIRRSIQRRERRDPTLKEIRTGFFRKYGIDFEGLRRQAAQARREFDMCLHEDDLRIFASKEDAARREAEPLSACELCGKARLRIPIIAPAWLAEIDAAGPAAREAFLKDLFR